MALEALLKGTLSELDQLFEWKTLSELVRVDYYKRCLVPDDEVFTLTTADFVRVGLTTSENSDET